jgi:hypothetical protein
VAGWAPEQVGNVGEEKNLLSLEGFKPLNVELAIPTTLTWLLIVTQFVTTTMMMIMIITIIIIFLIARYLTSRPWPSSFTRFVSLDHTQRHTTVGRTPLDE